MILLTALRRVFSRKGAAFAAPALLLGCTSLLGIDGAYVEGDIASASGGKSPVGAGGTAGVSGGANAGGSGGKLSPLSSGGTSGSGGSDAGDARRDGGGEAGVIDVDSGTHCTGGRHTGSFDGSHRPAVTVVGVPVSIDGTFSFDIAESGDHTVTGDMHASLTSIIGASGTLTATLSGHYDCAKRAIVDGKLTGTLTVVNLFTGPFAGHWHGTVGKDGAFTGTWTEAETTIPTNLDGGAGTCTPGGQPQDQALGTGCGTFSGG